MIPTLSSTTDLVEVVLGWAITTNQLRCVSSRRDITTTAYTPWRTVINTNNTNDVIVVWSPAASTQRVVDFLNVYNHDTVTATVTVKFSDNGTEYIMWKWDLATQERLEYQDWEWFRAFTSSWALKTVVNWSNTPATTSMTTVILASDVTNNNASANTIADVTWLSASFTTWKTYYYRACIMYTAAATTTGSRWAVNHAWGTLYGSSRYSLTTTSETINHWVTAVDSPAASNATSATTGANIAILEWFLVTSSTGTFIIRFASEVSSSAIVAKAG